MLDASPGRIIISSPTASHVDLCLFDHPSAAVETERIPLIRTGDQWTCDRTLAHGQLYALRARGPSSIDTRAQFAPERLLLDPRARAIGRAPSPLDPLGVCVDASFDWQSDAPPATPWRNTVIYEAHVKGLTALHPDVPRGERGTFLGLTAPAVIAHLLALGVTAVELLPVHACADEPALTARGLTNYWGYNTLSFFAPDPRFATRAVNADPSAAVREFQTMVRALHRAGLEVILDVVYNHTAEGGVAGPTLSWRGLDPVHTYRRRTNDPVAYDDWTGCGNTLNVDDPLTRALVLESLRYWVTDMHVDGFRFDLASALDRAPGASGSFFRDAQQDPILSRVKLIAEPWDATGSGYRLGGFTPGIAEWNGRFRDDTRRFWRGDAAALADMATRIGGSEDLFGAPGRSPLHSINFVTSHDGFTLADLVSYTQKHNETNGERNTDGESNNISSNAGVEGASDDPAIRRERETRQRSFLATLAISLGVPMLAGGDEFGRTQRGNNNAYCQDNPLSWTPWPGDTALAAFVGRAFAVRRALPILRRERFLTSDDGAWLNERGTEIDSHEWHDPNRRCLGILLDDRTSGPVLIYVNASRESVSCVLPKEVSWQCVLDSAAPDTASVAVSISVVVSPGSLVVLTSTPTR